MPLKQTVGEYGENAVETKVVTGGPVVKPVGNGVVASVLREVTGVVTASK